MPTDTSDTSDAARATFDWDDARRATNDVSLLLNRVANRARKWQPPGTNGRGVIADPSALVSELQEAQGILASALGTLAKTQWPTPENYRSKT